MPDFVTIEKDFNGELRSATIVASSAHVWEARGWTVKGDEEASYEENSFDPPSPPDDSDDDTELTTNET